MKLPVTITLRPIIRFFTKSRARLIEGFVYVDDNKNPVLTGEITDTVRWLAPKTIMSKSRNEAEKSM